MDKFFEEQKIYIVGNCGTITVFMRSMLVGEIPIALRIAELKSDPNNDGEFMPLLLELLNNSLSYAIDSLPSTALNELIEIYTEFNFSEIDKIKKTKKGKHESEFAVMFDFMIHEGYTISDLNSLTIHQFRLLFDVAYRRVMRIKTGDPKDILKKMGVVEKQGKCQEMSK